jgi:hypothetical protein
MPKGLVNARRHRTAKLTEHDTTRINPAARWRERRGSVVAGLLTAPLRATAGLDTLGPAFSRNQNDPTDF